MGKQLKMRLLFIIGFGMVVGLLAACQMDEPVGEDTAVPGEPTLNATQQAIAEVLTYQAENPRPTRTIDGWVYFVRTATAEAKLNATAAPTLNATQEAIAAILTYQAENPQPTKTRWVGSNILQTEVARRTQTPQFTPTSPPTATPTSPPTLIPRTTQITIPDGAAPELDGRIAPNEWSDGGKQTIFIGDMAVPVYFKHDAANLYAAFAGLDQGEAALFPELIVDTGFDSNLAWNDNDFWFHVSTNACQGVGPAALWQQCGPADGWLATDFLLSTAVIEMQIPYEMLGIQPGTEQVIGISWGVMALTAADQEVRVFWPETAVIDQPATWARGTAVGGW
jgi:hypothetical protein